MERKTNKTKVGKESRLPKAQKPCFRIMPKGTSLGTSCTYIISTSLDLLVQLMLIFIPEWRISHKKNIKDNS